MIAGGEGSRQGLLSEQHPKHLLPILNQPLIEYQLDVLAEYTPVRMAYSKHNVDAFDAYFDGREGVDLVKDETLKGPLYPLVELAHEAAAAGREEPVVGVTGDAYTFVDLDEVVAYHESHDKPLTIGLTNSYPSPKACVFHTDEDTITGFTRCTAASTPDDLINLGVYVADPGLAGHVPLDRESYKEDAVFPDLFADELAAGYILDDLNVNVNTPYHLLCANVDALERLSTDRLPSHLYDEIRAEHTINDQVLMHYTATAGDQTRYTRTVAGPDAEIAEDVTLDTVLIAPGATIGAGASLTNVIVAEDARVAPGETLQDVVVGETRRQPINMYHEFQGEP